MQCAAISRQPHCESRSRSSFHPPFARAPNFPALSDESTAPASRTYKTCKTTKTTRQKKHGQIVSTCIIFRTKATPPPAVTRPPNEAVSISSKEARCDSRLRTRGKSTGQLFESKQGNMMEKSEGRRFEAHARSMPRVVRDPQGRLAQFPPATVSRIAPLWKQPSRARSKNK